VFFGDLGLTSTVVLGGVHRTEGLVVLKSLTVPTGSARSSHTHLHVVHSGASEKNTVAQACTEDRLCVWSRASVLYLLR
jgi:hypothetical protein